MATAMELPLELMPGETAGQLANNYMLVQALQKALSLSETNINTVPGLVCRIVKDQAWKAFLPPTGVVIRNSADFREFIEKPRPSGCQTPIHVLRHMVKGEQPAEDVIEVMLRGKPGGLQHESRDELGRFHNRNEITVVEEPATIPLSPAVPRPRVRDYARESKQGTSVSYMLRRLEKRPDLLEKVKAGEMTPTGACVVAGYMDKQITIPADVAKASRRLLNHFKGDDLITLATELANHAGYDLVPKE